MKHWTDYKLQLFLTSAIFLVCYSILVGNSLGPMTSLDTYWHLKMGEDLLENGFNPWLDHYSFTHFEKQISSVPVLFQVSLAAYVSYFGEEAGFILFKITYITLLLIAIYIYFRKIKAPWYVIFLILPMLIYFINMRLIVRPDVISNILAIMCLTLYLRARENFSIKELLPIYLLLLFWVNYHTPILGYIIVFGLFLDRAIFKILSNDNSFTWSQWFLWGVISFLIGFVNPTFDHVLILIFTLSNEWYQYLTEYTPTYIAYSTNKMVHLSLLTTIVTVIWVTNKKQYGLAFITLILGYYAWSISRLLPAVSIINLCVFALLLSQADYNRFFSNLRPVFRLIIATSSVIFIIYTISQTYNHTITRLAALSNFTAHTLLLHNKTEDKFPAQISEYLNTFHRGGNILNTFNTGGYLIHRLSPKYKIYIDGRTNILYPVEFYKNYLDILNNAKIMENDIREYDINYAIFENTRRAHHHFNETDLLKINFADENHILFSRNKDIAFPLASKLTLFPMCWNNRFIDTALKEISLSKTLFPNREFTIKYILTLLDDYLSNNDKKQFIQSLKTESLSSDIVKRLATYIALYENDFQKAKIVLKSIQVKNNDDILMMSYVFMMLEEYNTSKSLLSYYLNVKGGLNKDSISTYDKVIIIGILTAIQEKSESKEIASFDIDQIKITLGMDNREYAQPHTAGLPVNSICNELFKF